MFVTKFLLFAPVIGIILPLSGMGDARYSILAALVAAMAAFLTADMVVFPRYGNIPAVIIDIIIAGVVLTEFTVLKGFEVSLPGMAVILAVLAAGEWYYHSYLARMLAQGKRGKKR